jgi:hypothetical protein
MLGRAAWRLEGPRAGAITAWLTALSAGSIQASHFWTSDSLLFVEIAMLLDACSRMTRPVVLGASGAIRGRGLGAELGAGIALGLIAATKMTGLLSLAVVPSAIAASPGGTGLLRSERATAHHWMVRSLAALFTRRFWTVIVVAATTYFVLCPWPFLEPEAYFDVPANRSGREVFLSQYTDQDYGFYDWRFTYNGTLPYVYFLTNVLPYAVGTPVLVAALIEMRRALAPRATLARIAALSAIPTFLLVGSWGVKTIRYALPSVPGLLLAAGACFARALGRGGPMVRTTTAVALAFSWARGIAFTAMFAQDDPRVLAGRWLRERLRPGDVVVVEPEGSYTAPLGTHDDGVGVEAPPIPGVEIRRLWQHAPSDVRAHLDSTLRGARFLVVGEFYRRRGLHPEAPARAPQHAAFYRALFLGETEFALVATFDRAPCLGPYCWDESDAEILAVSFDHMPVYVFERRRTAETSEVGNPQPSRIATQSVSVTDIDSSDPKGASTPSDRPPERPPDF